jgi:hypothetical protein
MSTIDELVDELSRLKPGSPAHYHALDVLEGVEWWNALYPREREYWMRRATEPTAAAAWVSFKLARAGDAIVAVAAREFGRTLFAKQ